jgi:hypothetical protein
LQEAGVFLREHTPPPEVGKRPGVLTPWDQAFYVVRYGERPVTANGFVPYVAQEVIEAVVRVWGQSEAKLHGLAESRDPGFVVLSASTYTGQTFHGQGPLMRAEDGGLRWNWAYFQGVPLATLLLGGSGIADAGVAHLRQLMPRFASTLPPSGLPPFLPDTWVYETRPGRRRSRPCRAECAGAPAHADRREGPRSGDRSPGVDEGGS